jgi:ATP-binding cassette subfamily B protein/subfamily B ATP-binding cassette protein MsbA
VTFDLRKQFFDHVLRLDMASIGKERASGLLSRFNVDISFMTGGLSSIFDAGVREPLKLIACLIGASLISWRLLVFSLLLTPLAAFLIQRLAASIKRANARAMEQATRLFSVLNETFHGIQTVQAYTMETHERLRFQRVVQEGMQKSMRIVFYNSLTKPVTEILGYTVIGLAFIAGAYLVLNQETHLLGIRMCDRPLGFTRLLLFYAMLAGASDPVRKFSGIYNSILGGIAAAERIYALLDQQPLIRDPPAPRAFPSPFRHLVFDHVSFHYTASQPVLRDVDFEVLRGETLCIVGANGCGKTTLANLLPRFIDPVQGTVRLDDVDLREMRLGDLRSRIGMVSQHATLFDDTVLENIRYGSPHATQQEVLEAAERAKAHDFIERDLENGYQTIVGTGGSQLSGGQRQRISLARAILRDPEILILDEATSHIDIKSEQLIHQALEEYLRGRTALIATHRLSTLGLADRIVVMEAGRILDIGTHQQLLARCGTYQRLHTVELRESA